MLQGRQDFRLVLLILYCQIKDIRKVAKSGRSRRSQICTLTVISETYNLEIKYHGLHSNLLILMTLLVAGLKAARLRPFQYSLEENGNPRRCLVTTGCGNFRLHTGFH